MTTSTFYLNQIQALADSTLLQVSRDLCADAGDTNPEYVRGCAEVIIDMTQGLTMDEHKSDLIDYLGAPLD